MTGDDLHAAQRRLDAKRDAWLRELYREHFDQLALTQEEAHACWRKLLAEIEQGPVIWNQPTEEK